MRLCQEAMASFTSLSLDAVSGRSEHCHPLIDTLGGTEPGFDVIVNREALRLPLRALPGRERPILCMRFLCAMSRTASPCSSVSHRRTSPG